MIQQTDRIERVPEGVSAGTFNMQTYAMQKRVLNWLSGCQVAEEGYDQGGILDPLDGRVIGDHYSTTHFAWACALAYCRDKTPGHLDAARAAMAFHIRTSPEAYPPGRWSYHWDFNNLAFVETFGLLEKKLPAEEAALWKAHLPRWRTNDHSATNWLAMRALALFKRGTLLTGSRDLAQARQTLTRVLAAQTRDGCFDDLPGISRPSQYHAYTACLVLRMRALSPRRITRRVVRAARWLLDICAPDGDTTYLGRGQGQIFGFACAAYLFRAACRLDPGRSRDYAAAGRKIADRLEEALDPRGFWPLVLNTRPAAERTGWYDYHHLTVYNAFALVWLGLADTEWGTPFPAGASARRGGRRTCRPLSGIFVADCPPFFGAFAGGREGHGYAADAGITPHVLFFKTRALFRYPVGPGPGKYGTGVKETRQTENLWAPLIRRGGQWVPPVGGQGTVRPWRKTGCRLTYEREGLLWERHLVLNHLGLTVSDRICLPGSGERIEGIRIVNIALEEGLVTRQEKNRLIIGTLGLVLTAWGDGRRLIHRGTVMGPAGPVDIFAMEAGRGTGPVSGGFRIRVLRGLMTGQDTEVTREAGAVASDPAGPLPPVACLSWDPWSDFWKRKQRLLSDLSNLPSGPAVIYSEPEVTLTRILENAKALFGDPGEGRRYRRAFKVSPERMSERFSLHTPLSPLPGARTLAAADHFNRVFREWRLKRVLSTAGFRSGILWLYHPSQIDYVDRLADWARLVVFDWTDDWVAAYPAHLPRAGQRRLERDQERLLARCDLVFAVSRALCRRAEAFCGSVFHLPNATDPTVFRPAEPGAPLHPLLTGIPCPRLAYLSQITERLDAELLERLALRRPDWQFVMIGPEICPRSFLARLKSLSNVHFLGPVAYTEAAGILAQCEVSILPHKVDDLTRTLDPIKLYDYLAVGNPVVATPVAMNPDLVPHLYVASGPDRFEAAVASGLEELQDLKALRRAAGLGHTWERRAEQALAVLRTCL